jgi:hypothetical protein
MGVTYDGRPSKNRTKQAFELISSKTITLLACLSRSHPRGRGEIRKPYKDLVELEERDNLEREKRKEKLSRSATDPSRAERIRESASTPGSSPPASSPTSSSASSLSSALALGTVPSLASGVAPLSTSTELGLQGLIKQTTRAAKANVSLQKRKSQDDGRHHKRKRDRTFWFPSFKFFAFSAKP